MTAKEFYELNKGKYFMYGLHKVRVVGYNEYTILTAGNGGWKYIRNKDQGILFIDESLITNEDKLWFLNISDFNPIEQELNLCELLKGCEGVELWSDIFGKCKLLNTKGDYSYEIEVQVIDKNDDENGFECFTQYGSFCEVYPNGKCMLWPSETNRDWSTFVNPNKIKEGTPVMTKLNSAAFWKLESYAKDNKSDFIVPVSDFDFTDFDSNKSKSIV